MRAGTAEELRGMHPTKLARSPADWVLAMVRRLAISGLARYTSENLIVTNAGVAKWQTHRT
jgi:hypothetical protein